MSMPSVVFADMADNLAKIEFDVIVKESYVPVIHPLYLGENAIAPIRPMNGIMDDMCKARFSSNFIIDALVNGHYVKFIHPEDMRLMITWIELYLQQHEGIDLSKYPERMAYNNNAKKALNMLKGNVKRYDDIVESKKPKKHSIVELLAGL